MTRLTLSLITLLLAASACGGDRERNEAVLLLDRLDQLDTPNASDRNDRIESLATLPIATPEVAAVRDHCVRMHRALLTADETSAGLRGALNDLPQGQEPTGPTKRALDQALELSNRALAQARAEREPCQSGTAALRTRFAVRRH